MNEASVKKLTDKQRIFVAEYLIDRNATQAAIRAGYSGNGARQAGSRLLSNEDVRGLVNQKLTELEEKAGLSAERVMREVAAVATSNIMDGMEFNSDTGELNFKLPNQIPEGFWRAAQEVTAYQLPNDGGLALKIKMHPKLPALKMEYDRHRLTRYGINAKNNIAKMHVNILELNAAKRRAGLPQERVSLVECLRELDEREAKVDES
jgi:phage terminase small subunit